jgi:enoyl-CoA hydratase
MTTDSNPVECDLRGGVLWVTLNRPHVMNALTLGMLRSIDAAMERAKSDAGVRCVVITGQGNTFCAGADLSDVPSGFQELGSFLRKAGQTMQRIERLSKPVIACVNGLALAGGLELALCADIIVAARSAELGDGHIRYGLLPGAGGSARLARAVGAGRARYLMFTGFRLSAERLESWGLVQQVVNDGELLEATTSLANVIARHSPLVLSHLKELICQSADSTLERSLELETAANQIIATSEDLKEGLAAFAEKRKPIFRGV